MKYFIYCRKSSESEDKQERSLEDQERILLNIAQKEGLEVVQIFTESMSAAKPGRPVFNHVMKLVEQGKVDGILCWKLNRLARNMVDGGVLINHLQQGIIKEIRTPEKIYESDENAILMGVEFGQANQFSRDLSVDVKRGQEGAFQRGEYPYTIPFGYTRKLGQSLGKPNKHHTPYIQTIFGMYATGNHSYTNIVEHCYTQGLRSDTGKKIYRSGIERILTNPYYCGLIRDSSGKLYQGKHKPMITKEIFDRVQKVREEASRPKRKTQSFPYERIMRCGECGCMITATRKAKKLKNGSVNYHEYYYCTNGKGKCSQHKQYMKSIDIDEIIAEAIEKVRFKEKRLYWLSIRLLESV